MPRNGSGQYNPLTNTWNPPVTGVLATGADFQAQLNDISAAITQSVSKDGQTPMTANLPMGNNSIVGIASGAETSPSISANGDTNTGLYFPAADTVAIATGGVKRVEVDANGNVGVGVTPSAWGSDAGKVLETAGAGTSAGIALYQGGLVRNGFLNVNGTDWIYRVNGAATLLEQSNGAHRWFIAPSGTAGNPITFTQAMTLDASGNLGLGTTSPVGRLTIQGAAGTSGINQGIGLLYSNGTQYGALGLNNGSGWPQLMARAGAGLTFHVNSDLATTGEAARIDSSGNLLVGTTDASLTSGAGVKIAVNIGASVVSSLSTNTNSTNHVYSTGAGAYRFYVGWGGTVYATSTTITGISDQRLKENIRDLDEGLNTVMALKPRKFDWKEGKGKGIKNDRGWIAQEFETVLPDMVEEWRDPAPEGEEPYKAVNANLIPVLVKAIQEQQAIIESLTARIAALEAK